MFLFKLLLSPVLIPLSISLAVIQTVAATLTRTLLIGLVAFAVVAHTRRDASGVSFLDRGIDAIKEKALSIDRKELITVSNIWFDWAKSYFAQTGLRDCPKTQRL